MKRWVNILFSIFTVNETQFSKINTLKTIAPLIPFKKLFLFLLRWTYVVCVLFKFKHFERVKENVLRL